MIRAVHPPFQPGSLSENKIEADSWSSTPAAFRFATWLPTSWTIGLHGNTRGTITTQTRQSVQQMTITRENASPNSG